jgi:hypothetical protein
MTVLLDLRGYASVGDASTVAVLLVSTHQKVSYFFGREKLGASSGFGQQLAGSAL